MSSAKVNFWVDFFIFLSFLATAFTGIILFFFLPGGIRQGGYQVFLGMVKRTWTVIHNWAGLIMIVLVIVHVILHWNWIVCMTKGIFCKGKKGK